MEWLYLAEGNSPSQCGEICFESLLWLFIFGVSIGIALEGDTFG